MNKPIVFLLSILASTIAPSVFSYDSAYAQEPITQQRCLVTSPADVPKTAKPEDGPIDTAKDLQVIPTQKVNLRCFFGMGSEYPSVESIKIIPPSNQSIGADPFAFTIESGKIKIPVFQITF